MPFLNDRMEDIGVIDPLNNHRPLFCRDATGKTLSHRDTNFLADLRMNPPISGHGKLLGGGIEQQHGCCVGLKELPHPIEQFDQKTLDVKMGQRRVSDGLNPTQPIVISARRIVLLTQRVLLAGHRHDLQHTHVSGTAVSLAYTDQTMRLSLTGAATSIAPA